MILAPSSARGERGGSFRSLTVAARKRRADKGSEPRASASGLTVIVVQLGKTRDVDLEGLD